MKKTAIYFFMFFWLTAARGHGMEAMEYFNLGLGEGMTHQKVAYFTKALDLNPKFAAAYAKRGMLYYFLEKYDKMIQDFENYIELEPAKAEAYRMLGLGYLKAGLFKAAISSLTRAIEMDANLACAYANRAEVYRLSGKFEEAVRDSTRAIKYRPDLRTISDALRTRAKVYWKIGRNTEAYADNKKALSLDPSIPKLWGSYWGSYPPLESMRAMGLIYLIGIVFVLIFGLKFRAPKKDE
jgi:tetratricopeptide (TPR) repeat protein